MSGSAIVVFCDTATMKMIVFSDTFHGRGGGGGGGGRGGGEGYEGGQSVSYNAQSRVQIGPICGQGTA